MDQAINPYSWDKLKSFAASEDDRINGPNNSHTSLRLFGNSESSIRVTLFRDRHAWCPYCQKVWLWLELKRIPYRIEKINMRCYGKKEEWFLKKVPSGMLPVIELDKKIITESDEILLSLEKSFGTLGNSLIHPRNINLRNLERKIFFSWCNWLCKPTLFKREEKKRKQNFLLVMEELDQLISNQESLWLDPMISQEGITQPGSGDVVFIPYLERMNASLAYYKGFLVRKKFHSINNWFCKLENFDSYRGTQGDFHTHAHDLPPQMGGCFKDKNEIQQRFAQDIDNGNGLGDQEICSSILSKNKPAAIALARVIKHKEGIMHANPLDRDDFEQPLQAALTNMLKEESCPPNPGTAIGLRYLRDRISVPRDMPLLAAREFRQALEKTAQMDGRAYGYPIPLVNRFDQNPNNFINS